MTIRLSIVDGTPLRENPGVYSMFSICSVEYTFCDSICCVSVRFVSIRCMSIRFVKYTFREYTVHFVNVSYYMEVF
jgi:hypothetical protein